MPSLKLNIVKLQRAAIGFFQKAPEVLVLAIAIISFCIGSLYKLCIVLIIQFTDLIAAEYLSVCLVSLLLHPTIICIYDFVKKDMLEKLRSKKGQEILKKIPFRKTVGFIISAAYDPAVCTLLYRDDTNFSFFRKLRTVLIFILSVMVHSAFWLCLTKQTLYHFIKKR